MRLWSIGLLASSSLTALAQIANPITTFCGQQCVLASFSPNCNKCNLDGVFTCTDNNCMCTTTPWINQLASCLVAHCSVDDAVASAAEFDATCIKEGYQESLILPTANLQSLFPITPTPTTILVEHTPVPTTASTTDYSATIAPSTATAAAITSSSAPIGSVSVQRPGLSGGAKAAIALGITLLLGALALGALFFLRRRKNSTLPRGIQPAVSLNNNSTGQAEGSITEKSYSEGYAASTAITRNQVAGTTNPIHAEDLQSPAPQYRPGSHHQDNYLAQIPSANATREASPRPAVISRHDMAPADTNMSAAGTPATNSKAAPFVWTRGRTLSRDDVILPVN